MLDGFHLRRAEGGTASAWLHKAGQPQTRHDGLRIQRLVPVQMHGIGHFHLEGLKIGVAEVLVEGQRGDVRLAAHVWYTEHIEIALELAVLTRCSVDGDEDRIEPDAAFGERQREIVLVDFNRCAVFQPYAPRIPLHKYKVDVKTVLVQLVVDVLTALDGDFVFPGMASGNHCYIRFHLLCHKLFY